MVSVAVFNLSLHPFRKKRELIRVLRACFTFLGIRKASVNVFLLSNERMRVLHRETKKKNTVTNVLSFPEPDGFISPPLFGKCFGEMYLAPSYIRKKKEDMTLLVIHGLLHLVGYSHTEKRDRMKMEMEEQRLLRALRRQKVSL